MRLAPLYAATVTSPALSSASSATSAGAATAAGSDELS
jgi:hypothetical protein